MDDPNITIEEYIRLEEDKARRHGKVYNWGTTTYGRNWYDDNVHDLRSVETEFPAVVFNDTLTSEVALSCEPMVSSLDDNKIDFRISFDESDDENYTLFNDLDYLKDFENEFPAIVYNDALTSKLDFLTEPSINPQHIDEFNFKYDTSFSKCGGEKENILYFNDLFPFNIIYPDDLKSDQDNDDKKIDIEQPWGDISVIPLPDEINTDVGAYAQESNKLLKTIISIWRIEPKTPNTQYWIPYGYGVPISDLYGIWLFYLEIKDISTLGLSGRMLMEYRVAQGQSVFTNRAWRRLFEVQGLVVHEFILEFFSTFRFGDTVLNLDTVGAL
ncbi:hypothetical protein Tco_1230964 [Tanacetum coccineum]